MKIEIINEDLGHSKLGASSMERWSNCPGSVALCETMPKTSSAYAEEGTLAHELAAKILTGQKVNLSDYEPEMIEAVQVYVDFVRTITSNCAPHPDNLTLIEKGFKLTEIHPKLWGTCDCIIYSGATKTMYVFDYKHGAGVPVSPENNLQLMYYGIGALLTTKLPVSKVVLGIVQPRYSASDAVKCVELDTISLLDFTADLLDAVKRTEESDAPTVTGPHCKFCSAKPICPALRREAEVAVKAQFSVDKLDAMDPLVVSELLSKLDVIEDWVKGVREFAYSQAKNGVQIPGYKLVPKRATRKWIDENAASKKLEYAVSQSVMRELVTDPELKSVAQVEKIIGADMAKRLFPELVVAVSSGDTLVPTSDKREAINQTRAASDLFDVLT